MRMASLPDGPFSKPAVNHGHEHARQLVLTHGWNAVAYQILNPGFDHWFAREGDAVTGYVKTTGRWVIAGAPVCAPERLPAVIEELETDARQDGCKTCYFGAALRLYEGCAHPPRHSAVTLGSQPVWDPASWPKVLSSRATVRAQIARARNKRVAVQEWSTHCGITVQQLREVLAEWLGSRAMPTMHFLVEPDTLAMLEDRLILVAATDSRVQGYLVASPIPARNGWLVEQIIRRPKAPNGTNELLLHSAMELLQQRQASYVTLGLVPLSRHHTGSGPVNPLWLQLLFGWVRAHGKRFYNFEGLEAFKSKFAPDRWEPIYAIASEPRFSPRTLWAIAAAFSDNKNPVRHGSNALAMAVRQESRQVLKKL